MGTDGWFFVLLLVALFAWYWAGTRWMRRRGGATSGAATRLGGALATLIACAAIALVVGVLAVLPIGESATTVVLVAALVTLTAAAALIGRRV